MNENKCKVEVFARVTGFFRPVQSWNKGKAEEFKDRKKYDLAAAEGSLGNDNSRITEAVSG
ncbi:MAG: anaerobic ribonucleoside-triphosphate reductase [Candidatus Omnitrophota bacterium]|nr:anaerobic ribonucleoside-triphosphate reductase [Candidatus Omnitrophota bacterium]